MIVPSPRRYPRELRDRAVQLAAQAKRDDPELSWTKAATIVGMRLGINASTLRAWCTQAQAPADEPPSRRAEDAALIRYLQAENRELRRANEVVSTAYALAARDFDPTLL